MDGRIILKLISELHDCLAKGRDQWRAVVNTVMNLQLLSNIDKFLSS
jgi:hypothetical protein